VRSASTAAALPEIVGVFVVSGSDDFLLHVAVPDTDALYAFAHRSPDRAARDRRRADRRVYAHIRMPVLEPLDQAS
jgi:DNA-binding Lrp family transcriptional regulator